jgi:hypothetical protein
MQISISILVGNANSGISYVKKLIKAFKARVLSYPTSIFEAEPCLDATLAELNAIGLLKDTSLVITPNAYNEGILYDVVPNTTLGDMAVVRATTATRVNSLGLIEVVPRNLLTYSEQFNDSSWINNGATIIANDTTSPNGTLTADRITGVSGGFGIVKFATWTATNKVATCFVKANTSNLFRIANVSAGGGSVTFNLSTLAITATTGFTGSIEALTNGWYRCTAIDTLGRTGTFSLGVTAIGESVFIWGAQLEAGSSATEYFPTTTRLNIPRIDYTNSTCPSLLVEPQSTNLLTYSEQFNDASWTKTNSTVGIDAIISPSGQLNADGFVSNTTSGQHLFMKSISFVVGNTYTLSVYAKKGSQNNLCIFMSYTAFGNAWRTAFFNLNTGTLTSNNNNSGIAPTITDMGNGWYRCTFTNTCTASVNDGCGFGSSFGFNYIGTNSTELYLWGAQIETLSYASSYIPTVGSTVTRNADVISKTGIYTNELISEIGGTWFLDLSNNIPISRLPGNNSGIFLSTTTSATLGNGFTLRNVPGSIIRLQIIKIVNGINTSLYVTSNNNVKIAIKWNGLTADIFENGVKVISSTSFTSTDMENMVVDGTPRIISVKSITIFPSPLSDQQCINLTTV